MPLSTNIALSVSCKIRTWAQRYLSFGWMRLPHLPSEGSQWQENVWPEHWSTSFYTCKLLWQFSYWCLSFWLFAQRSFPVSAVELPFGTVSGTNRAGEQEAFWYVRLFHQWFELVATASASFQYPLGLEAESSASGGWKMSAANDSETGRLRRVAVRRGRSAWVATGARRWAPWVKRRGRRSPSPSASTTNFNSTCRKD